MPTFKLIDNDRAQEIVDSIVISVGQYDAVVSSAVDGDIETEAGYSVANGLLAALHKARTRNQDVVYVVLEPGAQWDDTWGSLHPQD